MKTLIATIGFLALVDFALTPVLLNHIRKTGGFHILISTLHKLLFLALITLAGYVTMRNDSQNMLIQLVFSVSFLFLLNKTFEVNDYIFKNFEPEKYNLDGMTDESKKLMQAVMDDMKHQNSKPVSQRVSEMTKNFRTNFGQDLGVVYMVVVNDKKMKEDFVEIHKMMGNDEAFKTMSVKDMLWMIHNRLEVDTCVLVASGILMVFA